MAKAKALSRNQLRSNCARFVAEWADAKGEERQEAQSFVADLLAAFGITRRRATLYERRAKRASTGQAGYIDAIIPGQVVIEMKSAGKDLQVAENQALDYLDDLSDAEFPQWILTSDFKTFRLTDLENSDSPTTEFTLQELPDHVDQLAFLAGYQTRKFEDKAQTAATIKAAGIMAELYELLEKAGYNPDDVGIFLTRILFLLYADDAGLWQKDLFYEYIEETTSEDGHDVGGQLANLFQVLNKPKGTWQNTQDELLRRFEYVNGHIFADQIEIAAFNKEMRDHLLDACAFNWASISPAIFGSLFQAVKDPKARRELGEHYTTEANILKTIRPLFLDKLWQRYEDNQDSLPGLRRLRTDLKQMRFLDPACGCGNFLVVAYRELRALDLAIMERIEKLDPPDPYTAPAFFLKTDLPITLDHFAGIELEEWPARIAQTALHLVDHQANKAMELALGKAPEPLPLDQITSIHVGNALRMNWQQIFLPNPNVYIMGNPPFSGHKEQSPSQKQDLQLAWESSRLGHLDYVTGWYKKAADYFQRSPQGQFAFVSTNSIVMGENVATLFAPLFAMGWRIAFAHQTFAWSSEAPGQAGVHVVIIGMEKGRNTTPRLFTYPDIKNEPVEVPAKQINAYLIDGPNVLVTPTRKRLSPSLDAIKAGSTPIDWGHLRVSDEDLPGVQADPVASKYLRPYLGGEEVINDQVRWCLWLADATPQDISSSQVLRDRVSAVRQARLSRKREATRALASTPQLFGEIRQPKSHYLAIPQTFSENRLYATADRLDAEVIASIKLFTAEDPDGFLFGIISSSMFITWQKTIGGRLESRPSFSSSVVWNNLPLPEVPDKLREQIIQAGREVLDVRAQHPERSLAEHYNPLAMDPALVAAHNNLDRYVDKAFGAKQALHSNEERQAILLQRYQELTAQDGQSGTI